MKLFEATWREKYTCYERYYDTELGKSIKNQIHLPHEWYVELSNGEYTSILDDTIKLAREEGNAKRGRENYGFIDPMYRNIRDRYWGKDLNQLEPRIWYLDIETRVGTASTGFPKPEKALEPISLFQIYDNKLETMIILGLRPWKHQKDYKFDYPVKYIQCRDEIDLINKFLQLFAKIDPLIIYAWNGLGFDFPYIHNRMKKLGMDVHKLSNYGRIKYEEGEFQGKIDFKFSSNGHFFIDLMNVYKKFTFHPMESYQLDVVAEFELKQNKVQHTEYEKFDDFYTGKYDIPDNPTPEQKNSKIYKEAVKGNWEEVKELAHSEFVYYGCIDTYLIKRIDENKNFTILMNMISEKMGVQFSDSLGTVKPWAQYISNRSHQNKQIMPPKQNFDEPDVVGGYVRAPNAGKHKWVLSADVNSMYPLLGMVGFNMSPETFIPIHKLPNDLRDYVLKYFNNQEEEKRFDIPEGDWSTITELLQYYKLSLGVNGGVFTNEKEGMIPELVLDIYFSRKKAKQTMIKYQKRKILIEEIIKEKENVK